MKFGLPVCWLIRAFSHLQTGMFMYIKESWFFGPCSGLGDIFLYIQMLEYTKWAS